MPPVRRWFLRALDVLAVLVVLFALYTWFVAPRLALNRSEPAPPVTLAMLDGARFDVAAHRGRILFLDFWASWCEPCKRSIPLIQRYAADHPEVDVVSVDVGEPPPVVRGYVMAHPMRSVALDPDALAAHAFGVYNYPTLVAIDPRGNVRAKWVGFNPAIGMVMHDAERRMRELATPFIGPAAMIAPAGAAEPRPPTLVIEDEPSSLDTIRNTPFGWQLGPLTQGYLFLVDDRGRLVPDRALALPTRANGGISPDGRTITYRIRTGRWSDGMSFDARDVGFTIDALRNPRTSVPDTSAVAAVASWSAPRPDTLVVRLRHPSAPFVASFLTLGANDPFAILPRHIAAGLPSLDRSSLDTEPVGLGPFRLARWDRGQRLVFVRNPYAWRPAASARIDVAIVPDAQTRLVLARTGAIDLTEVTGFGVDVARTVADVRLASAVTNVTDYLQFNLRDPVLADRAVRRAIAAAIDRPRLAAAIYRGTLVPADSTQLDPRYRGRSTVPAYDPAAARAVLAARHLTLDLAIASNWRNSASAAVQLAADLRAAGLTVTIHPYTEAQFWGPKDRGGILESARYQLALTSWSPALDPDRSYLFGCAATPPGGGNSMGYCDPRYDRAEAAGAATYDETERSLAYRRAGDLVTDALPVLPLGFERRTYAVSRRLRGFRPTPMGRDFWNAWEFQRG